MRLTGGAQIASDTAGAGRGAMVRVTATDPVTLTGLRPDGRAQSGLFARALGSAGNAGSVVIEAPRVTLSQREGRWPAEYHWCGAGGTVQVAATDTLSIAGPGLRWQHPERAVRDASAGAAGEPVSLLVPLPGWRWRQGICRRTAPWGVGEMPGLSSWR